SVNPVRHPVAGQGGPVARGGEGLDVACMRVGRVEGGHERFRFLASSFFSLVPKNHQAATPQPPITAQMAIRYVHPALVGFATQMLEITCIRPIHRPSRPIRRFPRSRSLFSAFSISFWSVWSVVRCRVHTSWADSSAGWV